MPTCVVKWCRSHTRLKCPEITYHHFPAIDQNRKKQWIAAVRLERQDKDWMPVKNSRVCSMHFEETDFYKSRKGYSMLQKTAVPVCTMVRPVKISEPAATTSLGLTLKNENKNVNDEKQIQLDNETPTSKYVEILCFIPDLLNKPNILNNPGQNAEKRKLETNTNIGCNKIVKQEAMEIKTEPDSYEVYTVEEIRSTSSNTPIDVQSSDPDVESALDTPEVHTLKQKLEKKSLLADRRLAQIRNLKRRNKRLIQKNITLKNKLSDLKKSISYK